MKKIIIEKINKLGSMHVTTNPVNLQEGDNIYKYFIEFDNTYKRIGSYRNQLELEQAIDEILENGVQQNSGIFF